MQPGPLVKFTRKCKPVEAVERERFYTTGVFQRALCRLLGPLFDPKFGSTSRFELSGAEDSIILLCCGLRSNLFTPNTPSVGGSGFDRLEFTQHPWRLPFNDVAVAGIAADFQLGCVGRFFVCPAADALTRVWQSVQLSLETLACGCNLTDLLTKADALAQNPAVRFGLFSYLQTDNLGDEIQSLAARRFLPRVDYYLERDRLGEFVPDQDTEIIKLIMNGWYYHTYDPFSLSRFIEPLLVAMHVSPQARERFSKPEVVEFLRRFGPVGARDHYTLKFFRDIGVPTYFSACMTLTIERPDVERQEFLALNDLPADATARVLGATSRDALVTRHSGYKVQPPIARFGRAEGLLRTYAAAHGVITTRLHCALPSVAMNTPVLLIVLDPKEMRYSGLLEFVNHCSLADFVAGRVDWSFERPPANPTAHLTYRHNLIRRASNYVQAA